LRLLVFVIEKKEGQKKHKESKKEGLDVEGRKQGRGVAGVNFKGANARKRQFNQGRGPRVTTHSPIAIRERRSRNGEVRVRKK